MNNSVQKKIKKINKANPHRLMGIFYFWCQLSDLNQRPSDYKSDALPAELNWRHHMIIHIAMLKSSYFLITGNIGFMI